MNSTELRRARLAVGLFCVAATSYFLIVVLLGRFAVYDEIAFKSPGYHFAALGRFVAPELKYFLVPLAPSPDQIYGVQPPVYPMVYAGWMRVFGFGWRQAFAFDALIHVALCSVVALLAGRILPATSRWTTWLLAAALLATGTVGRPDELCITLCISALLLLLNFRHMTATVIAGALGAIALFTSPVGALCCAIASVGVLVDPLVRRRCDHRALRRRIILAGAVCAPLTLAILGAIAHFHPDALGQFRQHAHATRNLPSVLGRWRWAWAFEKWSMLATLGLIAATMLLLCFSSATSRASRAASRAILWLGCAFVLSQFHSPLYLWFFGPFLAIVALIDLIEAWEHRSRIAAAVAAIVILAGVGAGASWGWLKTISLAQAPADQSWAHNASLLKELIPANAVVLTDEYWLLLGDRNRVLDANFSRPQAMREVEYAVLSGNGAGGGNTRKRLSSEIETVLDREFTMIHDGLNPSGLSIFGRRIGRSNYGMGFVLLKRRSASDVAGP